MSFIDTVINYVFTPLPSPMACTTSRTEDQAPPKYNVSEPLQLTDADLVAILAMETSETSVCQMRGLPFDNSLGAGQDERIKSFAHNAAAYLVSTKYLGDFTASKTGDKVNYTFLRYDVARMSGPDAQIRDGLANLAPNQRDVVIQALTVAIEQKIAGVLSGAPTESEAATSLINFFYNNPEMRGNYRAWCGSSGSPRLDQVVNSSIPFPSPLTVNVAKADLLKMIEEAKKVAPQFGGGTMDASSIIALLNRDQALRTQVLAGLIPAVPGPHYSICSADPKNGRQGATDFKVTLVGEAVNLLDASNALPAGLIADFGPGVTVRTPLTLVPGGDDLSAILSIAPDAAAGKREITLKLGETVIGRLLEGFQIMRSGGGVRPVPVPGNDDFGGSGAQP